MGKFKEKFIGDKKFYAMVLAIAFPIMVQNGITHFVNLLDNIMVGRIGTEQMSGVSIVNQLIFIYNLAIFGGLSGAGIFTAQYFGQEDMEGIRNTFRFKLILGISLTAIAIFVLENRGGFLIGLFLRGTDDGGDLQATLAYGLDYLDIAVWGLIPFMFLQVYSSTLRECGETVIPMRASVAAVLVNLVFNYLLIYGKFGFPCLGVRGAAIATVLSRIVEISVVGISAHARADRYPYIKTIYRTLRIPKSVTKKIIIMGMPLLFNELLWSSGQTFLNQCYSLRGLNAVAAFNISSTIGNLFNVILYSMGATLGIVVGRLLGANKIDEAIDTDRKMIAFSVGLCATTIVFTVPLGRLFPLIYNTTDTARAIARSVITIQACMLPFTAFKNATYYTLRSGGKTILTSVFDCGMVWMITVPTAYFLSRYTIISAVLIYGAVQAGELLKSTLGFILVKKKIWIQNIVTE